MKPSVDCRIQLDNTVQICERLNSHHILLGVVSFVKARFGHSVQHPMAFGRRLSLAGIDTFSRDVEFSFALLTSSKHKKAVLKPGVASGVHF